MTCFILIGSLLAIVSSQVPNCNGGNGKDQIASLPGYTPNGNTKPYFTQYSGFVQVNQTANGSIFYWFIETISKTVDANTPVLIWLNGGPGASSLSGLFAENGPYRIDNDRQTLSYNNNSWINYYHMLFVDNPIGTGFSFCNNDSYVVNEDQMGEQFVNFIVGFYKCHNNFSTNPLYITGESYAGRYIPFIAKHIIINNDINNIPLAGLAIGNGLYDPYIQFPSAGIYAYSLGILDQQQYELIKRNVNDCLDLASTDPYTAADDCVAITNDIYSIYGGNIFQYNIYILDANLFDSLTANIGAYLSQNTVTRAIHTYGISIWKSSDGTSEPNPVYDALKYDIVMNNSAEIIPHILNNKIRILFYNGQMDGSICNNYGNQACLNQLNYNGEWIGLKRYSYKINGINAGYVKQSSDKLLTYFVVSDSGHLVPYDQPYSSLRMINNFVDNHPWF
eukprot:531178_1